MRISTKACKLFFLTNFLQKKKPTAGAATTDGGATGSGPNTARVPPVPKQATSKDQQGSSTDRGTQQQDTAKDSSRSVKTVGIFS